MHDTSKSGTTVKRHPNLTHSFWKVCCLYYTTLSHQLIIRFYLLQRTHYNLAEFQAKSSIVYSCKTSRAKQKAHLFIPCLFLGKLTNDFDTVPQKMHLLDVSLWIRALPPSPQKLPTNRFHVLDSFLEARYQLRPKCCAAKPHNLR